MFTATGRVTQQPMALFDDQEYAALVVTHLLS